MNHIIKIDVEKNDTIITKLFNIDETISEGFYLTMNDEKVNTNIESFGIKKTPAKSYDDIGVQYQKNGNCVIVTFNIKQPNIDFYGQFLIGEQINTLDILNCEHNALNGLQPILMDACDLVKVQTMDDLMKLKRLM
tara:strand:- start:9648 stop:10055 length:408 start_codon:yes stop_codon:yes gene_type:complete